VFVLILTLLLMRCLYSYSRCYSRGVCTHVTHEVFDSLAYLKKYILTQTTLWEATRSFFTEVRILILSYKTDTRDEDFIVALLTMLTTQVIDKI